MKAVDILISARARLAISKDNWTTHTLADYRKEATDGACFCAIGAVVNAAGGFAPVSMDNPDGCDVLDTYIKALWKDISGKPSAAMVEEGAAITAASLLQLARTGKTHHGAFAETSISVTSKSELLKKECKRVGYEYRAGVVAARYLNYASMELFGRGIIRVNDDQYPTSAKSDDERYMQVLAAFDLAIKRSRRRHPNGERTKAVTK